MIGFALKNMATKKVKVLLIVMSVVISSSVALLSYNIAEQIRSGIVNTAAYYDMIVGPSGSSTQLAMNTMFFTDEPLGTISYDYVEMLNADDRVNTAIPFAMGDSFNSAKIVGTKPAFLDGKDLREGEMFKERYEAVVGSAVAKDYGLKVGDKIVTSHGLSESGSAHESSPLTVVGILDTTKTSYDNAVFTDISTVWAVHEHEDEDGHDEEISHEGEDHGHEEPFADEADGVPTHGESGTVPVHGDVFNAEKDTENTDGTDRENEIRTEEGTVCAILVKSTGFSSYYSLSEELGRDSSLLVINPSTVLREVLDNVDMSRTVVYVLCVIILIMNVFVISTVTLLNMYDSKKEIALMRLIGVGTGKVNLLFLVQNAVIGVLSTVLSFLVSRLCIGMMGSFVAKMGIVLDATGIYPLEYAIMGSVFVISVLPTFICTVMISKKDVIRN